MIVKCKPKELKLLIKKGDKSKIDPNILQAVEDILTILDTGTCLDDFDLPGKRLHPYKEFTPFKWSLDVSGNVRILFTFENQEVTITDFGDPH